MGHKQPEIAVPARLSAGASDARVAAANQLVDDVVALAQREGMNVTVVDDAGTDLARFDGVLLPGGGDIDPTRYGGHHAPEIYDVNQAQDALDFQITRSALNAGIPVLGICRGLQVLNVIYGGTLVEDLPQSNVVHAHRDSTEVVWSWHSVSVEPVSWLGEELGSDRALIASGHHQGIRELGAGLTVTATADDGLIEAFEDPLRGVIAVQWHPEAAGSDSRAQRAPFAAFAARVRSVATTPLGAAHD